MKILAKPLANVRNSSLTKTLATLFLGFMIPACPPISLPISDDVFSNHYSPGTQSMSGPTHPEFTRDAILKLSPGMPLQEVEKLFGKPNSMYSTLCGPEDARWQCVILIYVMRDKYGDYRGDNKLYLNMRENPPTLDHWDLRFVY